MTPCSLTKADMLRRLESEYLKIFLAFSVSRISNYSEAEELAQEIACRCVEAIEHNRIRDNFDAYMWSIAHNTYKTYLREKQRSTPVPESLSNLKSREVPVLDRMIHREEMERVRLELSRLWGMYRETLVCFYYRRLSIRDIAAKFGTTEEMVKFYLRAGKAKLKEAITMTTGIKSISPSEFSIYKSAIDFSKVNVWEVFKRKLPCQIALICHDSPKTVSEISLETGTPAVYIEDEIVLLLDAGVMIPVGKNKYRTNFHILRKNAVKQMKEQFEAIHEKYIPAAMDAFTKYLPELKQCGIFRQEVNDNRYAWVFARNIPEWGETMWIKEYPEILSCGSKAFIFAEEAESSPWSGGYTPTDVEECTVWPADVGILGEYHCQEELRDPKKAQALYDVYKGTINDADAELYAQLIAEGYVTKQGDGTLWCNVAVMTKESKELFRKIYNELHPVLIPLCREASENMVRIVKNTIPEQLAEYAYGFAATWVGLYTTVCLLEALYKKGFITIPEPDEKVPVACWIDVK